MHERQSVTLKKYVLINEEFIYKGFIVQGDKNYYFVKNDEFVHFVYNR